jgi:hypothetical protein
MRLPIYIVDVLGHSADEERCGGAGFRCLFVYLVCAIVLSLVSEFAAKTSFCFGNC